MSEKKYTCPICNRLYETYVGMWRHKKDKHNKKDEIIVNTKNNFNCKYCNKELSDRHCLWRHENKTCKKNPDLYKENISSNNINISKSNNVSVNQIQNQTNNNITNNNITFNFNALGKEDILQLTEEETEAILKDGLDSLITLVKYLNFNKNLPQNHVFCNTNLNNKYISALNTDTREIEKHRKIDYFDKVFVYSVAHLKILNDNISNPVKQDDFTKKLQEIEIYLYTKPEHKKLYIEQINALSYNKRKDIQNTWNKLLFTNELND
jgi:hypothetical protein